MARLYRSIRRLEAEKHQKLAEYHPPPLLPSLPLPSLPFLSPLPSPSFRRADPILPLLLPGPSPAEFDFFPFLPPRPRDPKPHLSPETSLAILHPSPRFPPLVVALMRSRLSHPILPHVQPPPRSPRDGVRARTRSGDLAAQPPFLGDRPPGVILLGDQAIPAPEASPPGDLFPSRRPDPLFYQPPAPACFS